MDLRVDARLMNSSFKRQYCAREVGFRTPSPPAQSPVAFNPHRISAQHITEAKRRKLVHGAIHEVNDVNAYASSRLPRTQPTSCPVPHQHVAAASSKSLPNVVPSSLDVMATLATATQRSNTAQHDQGHQPFERNSQHARAGIRHPPDSHRYQFGREQARSGYIVQHAQSSNAASDCVSAPSSSYVPHQASTRLEGNSNVDQRDLDTSIQEAELLMNFVYASTQATPRVRTESSSSEPTKAWPRPLRHHSPPPPAHSSPPKASATRHDPALRRSSKQPDSRHSVVVAAVHIPPVSDSVTSHQAQDAISHEIVNDQMLNQPPNGTQVAISGQQTEAQSTRKYSDSTLLQNEQPNMAATPNAAQSTRQTNACASCHLLRRTINGLHDLWISCNGCKMWYHHNCAGFENERKVRDVDKYYCKECEPRHGATTFVRKSARAHALLDYAGLNEGKIRTAHEVTEHHYIQPIKDGKIQFQPESFPRMRPEVATARYFERCNGFSEPVVIPAWMNPRPSVPGCRGIVGDANAKSGDVDNSGGEVGDCILDEDFEYDCVFHDGQDKLDMVIPQGLTVRTVSELYGPDERVEVIDVKSQEGEDKGCTMRQWADYYESTGDKPVRNVISLEVSDSKLGRLIKRPKVVRDLDLQDAVWPAEEKAKGMFPKVQFYCLMSVADCYTDFHIDFGGSSVYYHIIRGKKTFFFIPPKKQHLKKYEEWCNSADQNSTFLGDLTKECYRVDLSEGDTMLIPSGWIHSVWTPENSLVIGGNFLTRIHYGMQIAVNEIEKNTNVARKFRYPHFQKVLWHALLQYLDEDPVPSTVVSTFYRGQAFERKRPVYLDFDDNSGDKEPEFFNARYYSQGEIDGLQSLLRYIFRTVMVSLGKVQGVTQTTQQAVIRSIPKGYGEPLRLVQTFAMWTAWKRGNELIPQWALPDADASRLETMAGDKKMSAAALKKIERKAAHEAYLIAPERRSSRQVMKEDAELPVGQDVPVTVFEEESKVVPTPTRPACKPCRNRRIKCKHRMDVDVDLESRGVATGTPQRQDVGSWFGVRVVEHAIQDAAKTSVDPDTSMSSESPSIWPSVFVDVPGHDLGPDIAVTGATPCEAVAKKEPSPDTLMVGTELATVIDSSSSKAARNKACLECRKSKRRCIHNAGSRIGCVKRQDSSLSKAARALKKAASQRSGKGSVEVTSTIPRATNPYMQRSTTGFHAPPDDVGLDVAADGLHDQDLPLCESVIVGRSTGLQYDPASPPYEATASIADNQNSTEPSASRLRVVASANQVTTQSVGKPGPSLDCITPPVSDHGAITTALGDRPGPEYDPNIMISDVTREAQADGNSAELNSGLANLNTPSLYAHSGSAEGGDGLKSPMPASPLTELATSPVADSSGRRPIKYTNYNNASPLSPQMRSIRNAAPSTPSRSNVKTKTQSRSVSKELAGRISSAGFERLPQDFLKGQSATEGVEGEDMRLARELQEQEFGLRRRSR